jgi:hypothetical protein
MLVEVVQHLFKGTPEQFSCFFAVCYCRRSCHVKLVVVHGLFNLATPVWVYDNSTHHLNARQDRQSPCFRAVLILGTLVPLLCFPRT